jgi:hypothetical protein
MDLRIHAPVLDICSPDPWQLGNFVRTPIWERHLVLNTRFDAMTATCSEKDTPALQARREPIGDDVSLLTCPSTQARKSSMGKRDGSRFAGFAGLGLALRISAGE